MAEVACRAAVLVLLFVGIGYLVDAPWGIGLAIFIAYLLFSGWDDA